MWCAACSVRESRAFGRPEVQRRASRASGRPEVMVDAASPDALRRDLFKQELEKLLEQEQEFATEDAARTYAKWLQVLDGSTNAATNEDDASDQALLSVLPPPPAKDSLLVTVGLWQLGFSSGSAIKGPPTSDVVDCLEKIITSKTGNETKVYPLRVLYGRSGRPTTLGNHVAPFSVGLNVGFTATLASHLVARYHLRSSQGREWNSSDFWKREDYNTVAVQLRKCLRMEFAFNRIITEQRKAGSRKTPLELHVWRTDKLNCTAVALEMIGSSFLDPTCEPAASKKPIPVWHEILTPSNAKYLAWLKRTAFRFDASVTSAVNTGKVVNLRNQAHLHRDKNDDSALLWRMACLWVACENRLKKNLGPERFAELQKMFFLGMLDNDMRDYVAAMDATFLIDDVRFVKASDAHIGVEGELDDKERAAKAQEVEATLNTWQIQLGREAVRFKEFCAKLKAFETKKQADYKRCS